jgi:hypothetical protein
MLFVMLFVEGEKEDGWKQLMDVVSTVIATTYPDRPHYHRSFEPTTACRFRTPDRVILCLPCPPVPIALRALMLSTHQSKNN